MAKGIREAALSGNDEDEGKENYDYNDYGYENYGAYREYSPYKPPEPYKDSRSDWEYTFLKPKELKIELIVTTKECGKIGDASNKEYDENLMLKEAERIGLEKLKELNPQIEEKYRIEISSEEGIDQIAILFILKPKNIFNKK